MWTLAPYFSVFLMIGVVLLLACPCCCGFFRYARSKRRAPFLQKTGVGFHLAFALLALLVVLTSLIALEEHNKASRAYSRAKCAAYDLLDTLVDGTLSPNSSNAGFTGFRRLTDAISSASTTFPDVKRAVHQVEVTLSGESTTKGYGPQAEAYQTFWGQTHNQEMTVTSYHCFLCSDVSLRPIPDSINQFEGLVKKIQFVLSEGKAVIKDMEPLLQAMMNQTLTDFTRLYSLCFQYATGLDRFFGIWERRWLMFGTVLRVLLACSLLSVALGIASMVFCRTECFPCVAWWFTYLHVLALLAACAALLPVAVFAHDVGDLLKTILTADGIDTYSSTILQNLNTRQRVALASCISPSGDGDLRRIFDLTVGLRQANSTARLDAAVAALSAAEVDEMSMDRFFNRYEHYDGGTYTSSWNMSRTLGWAGEIEGVNHLALQLRRLTAEHWAFEGAGAPPDCPLGATFDPDAGMTGFSCFLVTDTHPTQAELESRYVTMTPMQIALVTNEFEKARHTALALKFALQHAGNNALVLPGVRSAWYDSVGRLNTALRQGRVAVADPMARSSGYIKQLASDMNCRPAYQAFLRGSQALNYDFVCAAMVLTGCLALLAAYAVGLSALYCMLWSINRQGSTRMRWNERSGPSKDLELMDRGRALSSEEEYEYVHGYDQTERSRLLTPRDDGY